MTHFVHPQGLCESPSIGEGTRIWAFVHILPGAVIGRDCNICDHVFIENEVVLGDRVTVKCGVQLWDGIVVEDDVFIGPNATFTNDPFPRSKQYPAKRPKTLIRRRASIGAGATILPGLTIGQNAMVGAGAVVTSGVQANAIVSGSPARVVGYVDASDASARLHSGDDHPSLSELSVQGVAVHSLKRIDDMRGNLAVGEFGKDIPFQPLRYFSIFDVPTSHVRGEYALRSCKQFLICVKGACTAVVDNGIAREQILMDQPHVGLYVPPMTWSTLYRFSSDAILIVFASSPYDASDYVRDYQEYLTEVNQLSK
jgi:acetyltransferase-like isoleucine patch superfamily enzyme